MVCHQFSISYENKLAIIQDWGDSRLVSRWILAALSCVIGRPDEIFIDMFDGVFDFYNAFTWRRQNNSRTIPTVGKVKINGLRGSILRNLGTRRTISEVMNIQ